MKAVSAGRRGGRRGAWVGLVVGGWVLSAGCATTLRPAMQPEAMRATVSNDCVLGPGDVLDIKFFHSPELNEQVTVRPDGRISLQLVGEVEVRGRTPEQLRGDLRRLFAGHVNNPEVAVLVRTMANRRVYVCGEVGRPGMVALPGAMSPLEAIVEAGGFLRDTAALETVVVIRAIEGRRAGCLVNVRQMLRGESSTAFALQPTDVVYVPPSRISNVNQWMDQHIIRMVPPIGVSYLRQVGDTTFGIETSRRY